MASKTRSKTTAAAAEIVAAAAEQVNGPAESIFRAAREAIEASSFTARLAALRAAHPAGSIVTVPGRTPAEQVTGVILENVNVKHYEADSVVSGRMIEASMIAALDGELGAQPWVPVLFMTADGRPVIARGFVSKGEFRAVWLGAAVAVDEAELTADVTPFAKTYATAWARTPAGIRAARE